MPNMDKVYIDVALVRKLIAGQFPQWADLSVKPVEFGGWDNRTFHLGEQMTVRLPSAEEYVPSIEKEHCWLPKLAPLLPLPISVPLAKGKPAQGYPWHWSIYKWLDGETVSVERIADLCKFATALAEFLVALQRIDSTGAPHNFSRGGPLSIYDAETRQAIAILGDVIDVSLVADVWDTALESSWQGFPVWFHGDVAVGNLLVENGALSAVIDFGSSGVGDPVCDLVIAWTLFKRESRDVFRAALPLDSASWARGRGWALWKALIVCAGLPGTNSLEIKKSWQVINEVLADYKHNG
jgi:aminoglycoside phosphotransferase (APT) family kinase protein